MGGIAFHALQELIEAVKLLQQQMDQGMWRMDVQLQEQKEILSEVYKGHCQQKKAAQGEVRQAQQKNIKEMQRNQVKLIEELVSLLAGIFSLVSYKD